MQPRGTPRIRWWWCSVRHSPRRRSSGYHSNGSRLSVGGERRPGGPRRCAWMRSLGTLKRVDVVLAWSTPAKPTGLRPVPRLRSRSGGATAQLGQRAEQLGQRDTGKPGPTVPAELSQLLIGEPLWQPTATGQPGQEQRPSWRLPSLLIKSTVDTRTFVGRRAVDRPARRPRRPDRLRARQWAARGAAVLHRAHQPLSRRTVGRGRRNEGCSPSPSAAALRADGGRPGMSWPPDPAPS